MEKIRHPGINQTGKVGEYIRDLFGLIIRKSKIIVEGAENLNNITSPIIFVVSPHNGHTDSLYVRNIIPKEMRHKLLFVAAGDYWDKNKAAKIFANMFVRILPINRKVERKSIKKFLKTGLEQLVLGNYLVIFPEGTRHRKPGTKIVDRNFTNTYLQIIINAASNNLQIEQIPVIVPIYLEGTEDIMPAGTSLPRFHQQTGGKKVVKVVIGEIIELKEEKDYNNSQKRKVLANSILRWFATQQEV